MANYNDGNFHGWNGGECPVHPKSRVGGVGYVNDNSLPSTLSNWAARDFDWEGFRGAFRVTKEHKEPREWWCLWSPRGILIGNFDKKTAEERNLKNYSGAGKIIHVREVMEGEE
jgi:hypothetical protein